MLSAPFIRGVTAGLLALVSLSTLAATAGANHYDSMYRTNNWFRACQDNGWDWTFCRTDNRNFAIFRESGFTADGRANIAYTLDNSYNNTVLDVRYASGATYSGDNETDVIYQFKPGSVPAGYTGWAWCNDAIALELCDQGYAAFEFSTPNRGIACHETGHNAGLTHGDQAYPAVPNDSVSLHCMHKTADTYILGDHNVNQINAAY